MDGLARGVVEAEPAGHRGTLRAGDVQWMTAGAGVVHSEMPTADLRCQGGRVHGFQIWVNLPARLKMTRPRYQELPAARIPTVESPDGLARGTIIAGEALGTRAAIETHTPIVFQDWTLAGGADLTLPVDREQRALVYVFDGAARIGERELRSGQLAVLGDGDAVRLRGVDRGRLLLLAGAPHREPVVRHGPFVMNTPREIAEAIRDFQSGRMGRVG